MVRSTPSALCIIPTRYLNLLSFAFDKEIRSERNDSQEWNLDHNDLHVPREVEDAHDHKGFRRVDGGARYFVGVVRGQFGATKGSGGSHVLQMRLKSECWLVAMQLGWEKVASCSIRRELYVQ